MATDVTTETPTLHAAAAALAARNADMATEENAVGYNKSDSWFGGALAAVPEDQWTPEMRYAAWQMLRKYKKQLANYGIDFDAISPPEKPGDIDDHGVRHVARNQVWNKRGADRVRAEGKIERAEGGFVVSFPYDENTVAKVKEIPGRTFDGRTKTWFIPESEQAIAALARFSRQTDIGPADPDVAEWLDTFAANYVEKPPKRIEASDKDGEVIVVFPYSEELVTAVKAVGNATWDKNARLWRIKLDGVGAALHGFAFKYGFNVGTDVADAIQDAAVMASLRHEASSAQDAEINIDGLGALLRPFQKAGVRYLLDTGSCILGDEQGLGKTPQALAAAQKLDALPFVAVVPNLAKRNWLRETDFWLPERSVTILDPRKTVRIKRIHVQPDILQSWRDAFDATDDPEERRRIEYALHWDQVRREEPERVIETNNLDADVIVVNYDIIWRPPTKRLAEAFAERFPGQEFETIAEGLIALKTQSLAADESHYLKNSRTKRTQAVKTLARGVESELVWLLTGTPIRNRPIELAAQLDIINKLKAFGGWYAYGRRYCYAGQGYQDRPDFSGARNLEELNRRLREICYVRREKRDVLTELPPVQRSSVELALANPKAYEAVARDVISWVKERAAADASFLAEIADLDAEMQKEAIHERKSSAAAAAARAEILVRLNALRLVAAQQTIPAIIEWLTNWLEDNPDEKIIVFAWHKEIQQKLLDAFPQAARIVEQDNPAKRSENEHRFQEDPDTRMLVASINVAGISLTLTAAGTVAHAELPWVPGDIDQAEGRAYGRLNNAHGISAYYLLGEDTIYVDMAELLDAKREVVDVVTSGRKGASGSGIMASLVQRLLKLDLDEAA